MDWRQSCVLWNLRVSSREERTNASETLHSVFQLEQLLNQLYIHTNHQIFRSIFTTNKQLLAVRTMNKEIFHSLKDYERENAVCVVFLIKK